MFKKFAPRRKYARKAKPTLAAAKAVITKSHKAKAKKNMDTFFLRAKVQAMLIPVQGITVANYIYKHFPLMDPTDPLSVSLIPEFKMYQSLYDKVRVNSIHVKITPKANVLDAQAAQTDNLMSLDGDGKIHTVIDRDGPGPSSITALQKNPSYKSYSLLKPFSRMYSIKWPVNQWLDCQNLYNSGLNLGMGFQGGITVYAENIIEDEFEILNEPWAQVEVYFNCVFQGKTGASISVDEHGVITMTPYANAPLLAQSPLGTGTYHRGGPVVRDTRTTYDNSGNEVVVLG